MTIYFTKEYTIMSDYNKTPIMDYEWKTQLFETQSAYYRNIFKRASESPILLKLDKEPINPDRITLEIIIPLLLDGEQTTRINTRSIEDPTLSYRKVGRRHSLLLDVKEIMNFIEAHKDIFDETRKIKMEITYPIKTN